MFFFFSQIGISWLQITGLVGYMNFPFDSVTQHFLLGADSSVTFSENIAIFDCFAQLSSTSFRPIHIQALVFLLAPVILLALIVLLSRLYFASCCHNQPANQKSSHLPTTARRVFFMLLVLLHPTIARVCFSLFSCMDTHTDRVLIADVGLSCNSSEYRSWNITLGVLMLLLWVVGAPFLLFLRVLAEDNDFSPASVSTAYCNTQKLFLCGFCSFFLPSLFILMILILTIFSCFPI